MCLLMHDRIPERTPLTLVLTSRTDLEHRDWVSRLPQTELLEKPVSLKWLMSRLEDHFTKESALGGQQS